MKIKTRTLVIYSIFASISGLLMFFEFPIFPAAIFLKYDLSDVFIIFIGFFFGPFSCIIIGFLKTLIFFILGKSTIGLIEILCVFISSVVLSLSTIFPYFLKNKKRFLFIGILTSVLIFTTIMILMNYYFLLNIYGISFEKEIKYKIILNVILPFNVIKSILSSSLGVLLFLFFNKRFTSFIKIK